MKPIFGEIIRFVIVGGACTVLHYVLYYMMQLYMNVNIAYTAGYVISFIANFYLTSWFTFGATPSWKKLFGMGGAHAVNYFLHIILLNLFIYIGISQEWAPVPVFAIAIPVNFLLVRFVFKYKKS
ncbi:MAG: GtrA family protein [Prevotellamassilia sp.]|nr:GtrA family protein [Prevotellamassilia sp.]